MIQERDLNTLVGGTNSLRSIQVRVHTRIGLVGEVAAMRTSGRVASPTLVVAATSASASSTSLMRLLEGSGRGVGARVAREVHHLGFTREATLVDIGVEVVLAAVAVNAWIRGIGNVAVVRTVVGRSD